MEQFALSPHCISQKKVPNKSAGQRALIFCRVVFSNAQHQQIGLDLASLAKDDT